MTDYLALARRAPTPKLRRRYLARHREEKLRASIRACRACPLNRVRNKAVPWSGPIGGRAELVLVGEAPGADEDKQGVPFVGAAGRVLDKSLNAAGATRDQVAILNTLCCRPPKNRDPEPDEIVACSPNFEAQLAMISSPIGVAMGGYAAATILDIPRNSFSLQDIRGTVTWRHNMVWTFTYHPAYILRNRNMAGLLTEDLRTALDLSRGLDDISLSLAQIPAADLDRPLGPGIHDHLRRKGWAITNLRRLGVTVTVTRDQKAKRRLPSRAQSYPVYTLDELIRLGLISHNSRLSAMELRTLHGLKVAFNGEIVG